MLLQASFETARPLTSWFSLKNRDLSQPGYGVLRTLPRHLEPETL